MGTLDYSAPEQFEKNETTVRTDIYGEDHPEIAIDLNKLAMVQREMHNFEDALQTFQRAGEIFNQRYPETHYRVAEYNMELGKMYVMQNQKPSALSHLNRALELYLQNYDESHSSVQTTQEYIQLAQSLQ